MEQTKQQWQRHTAVKTWLSNLLNGEFVMKEGDEPNYLLCGSKKISRVNIIGVIVAKEESNGFPTTIIDDGSAKMTVRSFENSTLFSAYSLGDLVNVIARPREFGNDRYLAAELVKKITNSGWAELRRKELQTIEKIPLRTKTRAPSASTTPLTNPSTVGTETYNTKIPPLSALPSVQKPASSTSSLLGNTEEIEIEDIGAGPKNKIISIIKRLDIGQGADIAEVIKKSEATNAQDLINNLILQGDIFEVRPGKIKVLE